MVSSAKNLMTMDRLIQYVIDRFEKDTGNQLTGKRAKVESLLQERMLYLGNININIYFDEYLNGKDLDEYKKIISSLTVHHTYFFREFNHFEYLLQHLPSIVTRIKGQKRSTLKILSAGCSMGHEVYSLACFFEYHLKQFPEIRYEVHGFDVDETSVRKAQKGIYSLKDLKNIPQVYISGYWQKSTNPNVKLAKIGDLIAKKVEFSVNNLLEPKMAHRKYDLIFCRNVLIYFDADERIKILNNLEKQLEKSGEIFLGSSDFVPDISTLQRTTSTIYARAKDSSLQTYEPSKVQPVKRLKQTRVLIVDDSPTTRKLLKRIFDLDEAFKVVGEAQNGIEAGEFLKNHEVDVMTLDIHMPKQNGLEYMLENYSAKHPKVVVISGASREDKLYSQAIIEAGASDFVEKPTLANFSEKSEEIKTKVKLSLFSKNKEKSKGTDIFQEERVIFNVSSKLRSFIFTAESLDKLKVSLRERENYKYNQPPTILFFEGTDIDSIKDSLIEFKVDLLKPTTVLSCNRIYLTSIDNYNMSKSFTASSVCIFGPYISKYDKVISNLKANRQVLLEETPSNSQVSNLYINDMVPPTSFYHVASEFLAEIGDAS